MCTRNGRPANTDEQLCSPEAQMDKKEILVNYIVVTGFCILCVPVCLHVKHSFKSD